MRAPKFWDSDGAISQVLEPLSWGYAALGRMRWSMAEPFKLAIPVICVGNLVAGGAGKTPTVLAVERYLARQGIAIHILSRGYGGRRKGPMRVDLDLHTATDVGDEPLLHASVAPSWIARNRVRGAHAAVAAGAQAIVMDDGFQNRSLVKDLSLLVIDGAYGFGNGRVHPAGPLRERPVDGLARADGMVVLQSSESAVALPDWDIPTFHARLIPDDRALALRGRRVLAFAGIGRPDRFFHTLHEIGAEVVAQHVFSDHHKYREDEVWGLLEQAQKLDALAVTTAKDAVRLPPAARDMVTIVNVTLLIDNAEGFVEMLNRALTAGKL